jgi:ubiquinone/menaquinone biosynthesis C-methylase UbiE
LFVSPRKILTETRIQQGFNVLDYGCGSGSFLIPLSELVGESGRVYAADMHPLAIRRIENIASKRRLANLVAIHTDCETRLPDDSLDAVLLYDAFHTLTNPEKVVRELHRVLKPGGILSFSDHHGTETDMVSGITGAGLFRLSRKGKRTYTFLKRSSEQRD